MYTIQVMEDGENTLLVQEDTGLLTNFTRDELDPFTLYFFEVAAVTGGGTGPSVSANATTAEDGMVLST